MAKIKVDKDTCIGCATCEGIAPEAFEIKDGISCPKAEMTDENKDLVQSAIDGCPVAAISVEE